MSRKPFLVSVGAAVALVLALASCGSGGSSGSTPAPGHDSPQAAVMGLIRGLADHNTAAACGYFVPDEQTVCRGTDLPKATGTVKIGHTAISGDKALVVVMSSKYCIADQCVSNNDPGKGLPTGGTTFDRAYQATQNNQNDPTTPCQRVNGKWYVAG